MKFNPTPLEILLTLFISLIVYFWTRYGKRIWRWWKEMRKQRRGPRSLRPREPADCPVCAKGYHRLPQRPRQEVLPWSEKKHPAGRHKMIDTRGHACLNPYCDYYGIADPVIHALVSDGWRGRRKDILYLRCQDCGSRHSSRLETPLYHLRTPAGRVQMVMTALSEGVDISAATRIFGHHHSTISRWLVRVGRHSQRLQERLFFRSLDIGHLQLDELVAKVKQDPARQWIWTAIAATSKVIMATHIGGRRSEDACHLAHQIQQRLTPDCLPVFTSDGLNQYFHGLTAHFGFWKKPPRARKFHWFPDERLQYAQLRKDRRGYSVKFLYSIIRLGTRQVIRQTLKDLGFTGRIQTAYVERANLTLRELIAPLSRRTWSIAHDVRHLELHIQWGLAYYHLARSHQSLQVRVRGPSRYRYRTPAMAAELTSRRWSVLEILSLPVPEEVWTAPFPAL